jgi:N-acetylmuramic acid 6-phosphate etherase
LCILLEAAWRRFWQEFRQDHPGRLASLPDFADRVVSVMTGGDYALIRSVEGLEDYPRLGRRQIADAGVAEGDTVVAITEGGETSFVIGTVWETVDLGAQVFFVFNNPADVLCQNVERSREVIEDPRVTSLDLSTGPMAVAGSTRMQATSSELLVVGAALETALTRVLMRHLPAASLAEFPPGDPLGYAAGMGRLVAQFREPRAIEALARFTLFEENLYRQAGLVTYAASDYLLDILTDTTERAPTFRLPPFRMRDDEVSARSWAFVKNPLLNTRDAWQYALRRPPRGLDWTRETYRQLGAGKLAESDPRPLDSEQIQRFQIGNETDRSRFEGRKSALVMIAVGEEIRNFGKAAGPFRKAFDRQGTDYDRSAALCVGSQEMEILPEELFQVPVALPPSPLNLWHHLAVKLAMNTISTATMARMGRIHGNWMVHVETTNKKLIDRGTRLIAELSGLSYEEACLRLHETMEEVEPRQRQTRDAPSPVALALERLGVLPADSP